MSSSRTQPPAKIDLSSPDLPQAGGGPTSPQLEKSAARAISSADSWKPALAGGARRQSYHMEDQKHALQMSGIANNGGGGGGGGAGLGEKKVVE